MARATGRGGGARHPLISNGALAPVSLACPEGSPGKQEPRHAGGERDGRRALPVSCREDYQVNSVQGENFAQGEGKACLEQSFLTRCTLFTRRAEFTC